MFRQKRAAEQHCRKNGDQRSAKKPVQHLLTGQDGALFVSCFSRYNLARHAHTITGKNHGTLRFKSRLVERLQKAWRHSVI